MKMFKQSIFKILFLSVFLSAGVPSLFGMKNNEMETDDSQEDKFTNSKQKKDFISELPDELGLMIMSYFSFRVESLDDALILLEKRVFSQNKKRKRLILDEMFQRAFFSEVLEQSDKNKFTRRCIEILIKEKSPCYINQKAFAFVATEAASEGMLVEDSWVRQTSASDLFEALVEKGYEPAFEAATQAATENVKNENWMVRDSALDLFKALVKKEYAPAFEATTQAAKERNAG